MNSLLYFGEVRSVIWVLFPTNFHEVLKLHQIRNKIGYMWTKYGYFNVNDSLYNI